MWRICHPDGDGQSWYVAFLRYENHPVTARSIGLITCKKPPEDAIQFGRKVDAENFAQAFLAPDIAWLFVTDAPAAPPAWFDGDPSLMGCQLAAALDAELDRPDPNAGERERLDREGGQGR